MSGQHGPRPDGISPQHPARHSSHIPTPDDAPTRGPWEGFWFTPGHPFGLHVIRVAVGSLLIFWLLALAADAEGLFGLTGWFDRAAIVEASKRPAEIPKPFSWSLVYLCGESVAAFRVFYWGSLGVILLFTLGIFPRVTSVLTWLATLSLTASPVFEDEVEVLFRILTLYLAVGYVLSGPWKGVSWAERVLGPWRTFLFARREGDAPESVGVNVALRLIQVHLAILLVTSALHKLQSSAWWSGVAYWYHLVPPLELTPARVRGMAASGFAWMVFLNVACYATLAWQLAFPAFAWRTGWWRALLFGGAVAGCVGLVWIYRMPLFGPALLAGCLAFLTDAEWERVRGWVAGAFARMTAARAAGAEGRAGRRGAVTVGGR